MAVAPVPERLRCEYRTDPLGIDTPQPRLSWLMESPVRGQRQTAYHLLVARTAEALSKDQGDLWDSGKVVSDRQHLIDYAGKPLESRLRCYWKVRIWDKDGNPSGWSQDATWTMGLLAPDDWHAQWIGAEATPRQPEPAADDHLGYHAAEAAREEEKKWVQVDLGKSVPINRVVLHALNHGDGGIPLKGFGFPLRFRIDASDDPDFKTSQVIVDHTAADYPNPGHVAVSFTSDGVTARHVRVTATKLWNRHRGDTPYCFALAQLQVFSNGSNAALKAPVTAQDSVENWGWAKTYLTDGRRFSGDAAARATPGADAPPRPRSSFARSSWWRRMSGARWCLSAASDNTNCGSTAGRSAIMSSSGWGPLL
ncbi:MAG: discoidin domain-containing protein [Verrucomicrobia bacterium]|nr:discoidin domain-containing protein [Verrucomicrobiota bacterium]